uniref:Uncharacterized protein n=1 Tax=Ditylum brightwellii TaxID=49249 RepID=A0A7S1ZPN5_9STRA|mmetsp:Transcript_36296/g.54180  ORF Transcript_36296/g.54180 Transcript_36296/m.54180 type:complete len:157 (+) Transcript_36296:629-1099(+)
MTNYSCAFFFHHGQPIQQDRGSGGVAILLGGNGIQAWKKAGSPDAIHGDLIDGIAQSMGLEMHMKDKHNKVFKYFIITAYHPDSDYGDDVHATFLESLADIYSTAPSDATILSGEDINAQLGCNVLHANESTFSNNSFHKITGTFSTHTNSNQCGQ